MITLSLILGCVEEEAPPPPPTFEPSALAVGFDGVITETGTISGYGDGTSVYTPALILQFVSDVYADATDIAVRERESCVAIATFEPPPLVPPEQIPTIGDTPLFVSFDTTLVLDATSCAGRADPAVWGDEAEILLDAFDGARVGVGFGPMTDTLRAAFTADVLDDYGAGMLALWAAFEDVDGAFVAVDRTMSLASEWNPASGKLVLETDAAQNTSLVAVDVSRLAPPQGLPAVYLESFPVVYQPLAELGIAAE